MSGQAQTVGSMPKSRERIELILSQLQALPSLPAVAIRVLDLTTAADSNAAEVTRLIKSDVALTSAILRMLRRADLGVKSEVVSVDRAVVLLGFRAVRNAILSQMLFATFSTGRKTTKFWQGFWRHSLGVACAAERLAELLQERALIDQAFVAGLLHDVGKIAMDTCMPKSYARVLEQCRLRGVCLTDIEQEVFGLDHTVAGKRLANHWQLPEAVRQCIWLHHQAPDALPPSVRHANLINLIHVADNLVRREHVGFSGYGRCGDVESDALAIGLPVDRLRSVAAALPELMAPWLELVALDDDSDPQEAIRALTASNRELGRVNAQLLEERERQDVSVRFLAAMNRLCESLSDDQTVQRVCALAARAVVGGFGLERCAAYARCPRSACLSVGWSSGEPDSMGEAVWREDDEDLAVEPAGDDPGQPRSLDSCAVVGPPPVGSDRIWHRCFPDDPEGAGWHLPILVGGRVVGGLLFHAAPRVARAIGGSVDNCRALARLIGLGVSTTQARSAAEQLNEELFDLNRRLGDAQAELVRVRSLSMIGEMAAGASHELNNPLAVISARAQMLLAKATDEDVADVLRIVRDEADNASRIVAELMSFAKPAAPNPALSDLAGIFDGLRQHWEADPRTEGRCLECSAADPDLRVYADRHQVMEVLLAVMTNAVQATDAQMGRVSVNSASSASDKQVRIVIEDNGVGMSPEVLEHALDPFYSSRSAGRGRGLGLSLAHRLAEINGGRLCLESIPGGGTTVTIDWPAQPPST